MATAYFGKNNLVSYFAIGGEDAKRIYKGDELMWSDTVTDTVDDGSTFNLRFTSNDGKASIYINGKSHTLSNLVDYHVNETVESVSMYLYVYDIRKYPSTSAMTSMNKLLYNCARLVHVNTTNFSTSKVTDMSYMFNLCNALKSLDVSMFDTSKVTDMSWMFASCNKLPSLDLSNFDTSKVTDMSRMFSSCYKLSTLNISNFNTENVTDMYYMFYGCEALKELDLSHFDVSNVTDMHWMFSGCSSLSTLKLNGWDMSNLGTDKYDNMFRNCSSLKKVYAVGCNEKTIERLGYVIPSGCQLITT